MEIRMRNMKKSFRGRRLKQNADDPIVAFACSAGYRFPVNNRPDSVK